MTKILITGIAGFIGSNTADYLLKEGYEVVGLDNFSTGHRENLESFKEDIDFFEADITDIEVVRKAMRGVDYVIHYAALPSVPYSVANPRETHEVNVNGTLNILLAARDAAVKKLVFASSAAVYGDTEELPVTEKTMLNPLSPYAAHKIIGEYYCKLFNNAYGLRTTALRYFNVYGKNQDPSAEYAAVVPKFMSLLKHGKQPIIYGDGEQTRDFINVKDVIRANLLALKSKESDGKVYNIASGKKISVLELLKNMNLALNTDIKPIFEEPRAGDVKHSYASIEKAKEELKFKPGTSLKKGISEML